MVAPKPRPKVEWQHTPDGLKPFSINVKGEKKQIDWAPQRGSQDFFLQCPDFEVLYEGTRGPGKTDALIMDFAQFVGLGFGAEWRGILFRRTYPELADVIEKSKKWFNIIWPGAKFNEAKTFWEWPSGERLYFRSFLKPDDYWKYHGHAYPWIGWEELTTWATDEGYKRMMSCCRSTKVGMPRHYRSTTNPYGVGHNWVKKRFGLPIKGAGAVVGPLIADSLDDQGFPEPPRRAIHGSLSENRILISADPQYELRIRAAARNPSELAAWIYGSWDIVAGGMFDDVWSKDHNVVPNIPYDRIPGGWIIDRSYDHGSSKPFSVGWWAESNGEPIIIEGRTLGAMRGDLIRINEWYGSTKKDNEGVRMLSSDIAQGILDRETDMGIKGRVKRGPADTSIFDDYEPGNSVAGDMAKKTVYWEKADKGPGSRKQGWEMLRKRFGAAMPVQGIGRTEPGVFVCERCAHFLRTIPVLPRDDKDLDDVDTDAEDHIGDETRYRVRWKRKEALQGKTR